MYDQWELICFTHKWMADNMPPVYDTHGIEMSIWKEKNDPLYYLPEDHIDYDMDNKFIEEEYYPEDEYIDEQEIHNEDSSESEYDDDIWY